MLSVGTRVQLHSATDRWMAGDRFGVVVAVRKVIRRGSARQRAERPYKYKVKLDKSGHVAWLWEEDLTLVE